MRKENPEFYLRIGLEYLQDKKYEGAISFLNRAIRVDPNLAEAYQFPSTDWKKKPRTGLRTTWLGHSTVLIEIDGRRVLADPVWGLRASPSQWAGPKRFQPVPVAIRSLPPLDAVVISHDHYDHLDYGSICALAQRDVPFVSSLGVGAHLESWGVPAHRIFERRLVGVVCAAEGRPDGHRCTFTALLRSRPP